MKNPKKITLHRLLITLLFAGQLVLAQEGQKTHVVAEGETLAKVAQRYKVTPYDIIKLNPNAAQGVKANDVLVIPKSMVIDRASEAVSSEESKNILSQKSTAVAVKSENFLNEFKTHIVQPGETKFGLGKLYGISISVLEEQNPHIVLGLQAGHVLKVKGTTSYQQDLSSNRRQVQSKNLRDYTVLKGETLFGLSKRFGISLAELMAMNRDRIAGILKEGQLLYVPAGQNTNNKGIWHEVVAGETKFGLSRRYKVTINALESANPQIVRMLQTGQRIRIPIESSTSIAEGNDIAPVAKAQDDSKNDLVPPPTKAVLAESKISAPVETKIAPESVKISNEVPAESLTQNIDTSARLNRDDLVDYTIQPKETLFGLSKRANMKIMDFLELNPILSKGVQIGMVIKMPKDALTVIHETSNTVATSAVEVVPFPEVISTKEAPNPTQEGVSSKEASSTMEYKDVLKTADFTSVKRFAFMVSFSESDWQRAKQTFPDIQIADESSRLEIIYHMGVEKALDSLNTLGYTISSKMIHAEGAKKSFDLKKMTADRVWKGMDAAFLSGNCSIQKMAFLPLPLITEVEVEGLKSKKVLAIQPEMKVRERVLDVLVPLNANVIVVSSYTDDNKKQQILKKLPQAQYAVVSERTGLDNEDLKRLLVKGKMNVIILETTKNSMIISSTNTLLNAVTDYNIQVALLEPKLIDYYKNISPLRMNILRTLYPTYAPIEKNQSYINFVSQYRKVYRDDPDSVYMHGFDIVFDTALRMAQVQGLSYSLQHDKTKQTLLQFEYDSKSLDHYENPTIFLLQREINGTIKEIKP
jgi:LysM repeat protein